MARAARVAIIENEADIARGVRALRRKCATFRYINDCAGNPPLRRGPAGLEGLLRIVVGQQLSVASAAAIWGRFAATFDTSDAAAILAASDQSLRAVGLSRPKIRTLRAVAAAVHDGGIDPAALGLAQEEEIRATLTAIPGIGPWTADIFVMFCVGRADAFAAGDLALQVAAQRAFGLADRPGPDELLDLAQVWRPWRAVAARQLWTYYGHLKERRTLEPV